MFLVLIINSAIYCSGTRLSLSVPPVTNAAEFDVLTEGFKDCESQKVFPWLRLVEL